MTHGNSRVRHALVRNTRVRSGLEFRSWMREAAEPLHGAEAAHRGVELTWIDHGTVHYRADGRTFSGSPGSVVMIPAGSGHQTSFSPHVRVSTIELSLDLLQEFHEAIGAAQPTLRAGLVDGAKGMHSLGMLLDEEIRLEGAGQRLAVDALVEAMLVRLYRSARTTRNHLNVHDARIGAALEFIRANFAESISIEQLARVTSMSRFHFSRRFREQTGLTPYQYLTAVRIDHAAHLLRRGRSSVTEAAFEAGFRDLGRFSRTFHARVGVKPSTLLNESRSRRATYSIA